MRDLFRSLRFRLLLLVLLTLAPASSLFVYDAWEDRRRADAEVQHDALRLTQLVAANLDGQVEQARQLLLALSQLPEVRSAVEGCRGLLGRLLQRLPMYENLGVIAADGRLVCVAGPTAPEGELASLQDYRRVVDTGEFTVGDFHIGAGPVIGLGHPVFDATGRTASVVFATLRISRLDRQGPGRPMPEGRVIMVVDGRGTVLAHFPDPQRWSGRLLPDEPVVAAALLTPDGTREVPGLDGVERLYAFSGLRGPAGDLHVLIGFDRDSAFAPAGKAMARNLALLGLMGLVALLAGRFVAETMILRRLKTLVAAAGRLKAGDMAARAYVGGRDEIATLAASFNDMAARLSAEMLEEQRAKEALARRVDELVAQRTQEVDVLNRLSELLQASDDVDEAYGVIGRLVQPLFPDESGWLAVYGGGRDQAEVVARWGPDRAEPPEAIFRTDSCWGLRRGRPYIMTGPRSGPPCRHLPSPPPSASMCLPLAAQGETLGLLHLHRGPNPIDDAGATFPETKVRFASMVAEQISLSLANLRLRDTLRAQSIRDPVTGLYNRRYMEETLERELRRAERAGRPLGVVMLDIDHFKQFNDAFGHDSGDTVLRRLGDYLQANLRRGDVACRQGGEEFVLIMPETTPEDARRRADQLREGAKDLRVAHLGRSLGTLTVSIGVAAFPQHGTTGDGLLKRADAAMYRAKQAGRDKVLMAE
jgi:diguanylate cyclase (GGDEF)-like protein